MKNRQPFLEPNIQSTISVKQEKIYDFYRKEIFSPDVTNNNHIRCCTVSGDPGAASRSHTHPGDELVITLAGQNTNYLPDAEITLYSYQAIAIPPETEHTSIITGTETWKGISFYCDACPLIVKNELKTKAKAGSKTLWISPRHSQKQLRKQSLFSPGRQESSFLELSCLSSASSTPAEDFLLEGEVVYFVLSGTLSLTWNCHPKIHLKPHMAAVIPAMFSHQLQTEHENGCSLIVCTCASCPLAK